MKVEQRCTTPRCVSIIEKYGEIYHSMHATIVAPSFFPTATMRCEGCGGFYEGETVKHCCSSCGKDVLPGELVGLFVPHSCQDCLDKQRQIEISKGSICLMCKKPFCDCCC